MLEGLTSKAAMLDDFHKELVIRETPVPEPGYADVVVRIRASGLCSTDLHIQEGMIKSVRPPYIPGHEGAGEIYAVGPGVKSVRPGDHVIIGVDITCENCRHCLRGFANQCPSRVRIGFERDGTHQQFCVVPEGNVYKIDPAVPFDQACIIPDAVVCMYHAIKDQGEVRGGDTICILGTGGLGLQGVQIAKYFGAEVISTSRKDDKLALATAWGSDHVINTATQDLVEEVARITGGGMCDVVFDNIGIESSVETSLRICRPGGKVVLVAYTVPTFRANYQDVQAREKELIGIRGSTKQNLMEVIPLVERGIVVPHVYKRYPLEAINQAFADLKEGRSLSRTVVLPWG